MGPLISFPVWVYNIHLHYSSTYTFSLFLFAFFLFFIFSSLKSLFPFFFFCLLVSFSFVVSSYWAKEYFPVNAIFLPILKQPTSIHWASVRLSVLPSSGVLFMVVESNCLPFRALHIMKSWDAWLALIWWYFLAGGMTKAKNEGAIRKKSSSDCELVCRAH